MKTYVKLFLIILFILIIIASGIGISYLFYLKSNPAYNLNENNKKVFNSEQDALKNYNNYKYRISYWFGNQVYIYYYDNETIKVVNLIPESNICEGTNCMYLTGRYVLKEEDIKFSNTSKEIVINCFDELYKLAGKREIDTNNYDLSSYQDRILIGVILNDETEFNEGEIASNYIFQFGPDFLNTPSNSIYIYDEYFLITKTGPQEEIASKIYYEGEITPNNREKLMSLFEQHIYKTEEDCKDSKYILKGKNSNKDNYNSYCFQDDNEIKELLNYNGEIWYVN